MPCSASRMSRLLALFRIADEQRHDVGFVRHHGEPCGGEIALARAARSWWRSRSHYDAFRWRIAAVAAAQIAGGNAVVKMNPGS